jgi:hypothetical protein
MRPDLILVALADGAEENWRFFDGPLWVKATKIVDFGHASQHLKAGLVVYYGEESVEGRAEYERLKVILKEQADGVGTVIETLLKLERSLRARARSSASASARRKELLRRERKYFENQRGRMDYAAYRRQGPAHRQRSGGSGVQDARDAADEEVGDELGRRQAAHSHDPQPPAEQPLGAWMAVGCGQLPGNSARRGRARRPQVLRAAWIRQGGVMEYAISFRPAPMGDQGCRLRDPVAMVRSLSRFTAYSKFSRSARSTLDVRRLSSNRTKALLAA